MEYQIRLSKLRIADKSIIAQNIRSVYYNKNIRSVYHNIEYQISLS